METDHSRVEMDRSEELYIYWMIRMTEMIG